MLLTRHEVWIANYIYLTLITRNYRQLQQFHGPTHFSVVSGSVDLVTTRTRKSEFVCFTILVNGIHYYMMFLIN